MTVAEHKNIRLFTGKETDYLLTYWKEHFVL
jgi:hypothetical protein